MRWAGQVRLTSPKGGRSPPPAGCVLFAVCSFLLYRRVVRFTVVLFLLFWCHGKRNFEDALSLDLNLNWVKSAAIGLRLYSMLAQWHNGWANLSIPSFLFFLIYQVFNITPLSFQARSREGGGGVAPPARRPCLKIKVPRALLISQP